MNSGRAALVLAASSAFLACAQISGLSGLGFGGGGGSTTSGGGGSSSSRGGAAGMGGIGGQGQGGSPDATGTSTTSAVSASSNASSGPVSSAMSSSSSGGGGGTCVGSDRGVCCPLDHCATTCCHSNATTDCQSNLCGSHRIRCDSSSDCPGGQICCGYYDGTDFNSGIDCQTTCPKPTTAMMPGTYEICSLSNPDCVTGGTCDQMLALPGDYGFCF